MYIINYPKWTKLFEQQDVSKKKEKQVEQLKESDLSEENFAKAFYDKINKDTGENRNMMGKVPSDIGEGIIESIIYSGKTPKKFYKNPMEFKFRTKYTKSAKALDKDIIIKQNQHITGTDKEGKGIPYIDVDGNFKLASKDDIVTDINSKNADLYAEKKGSTQYKLMKVKQKAKPNGFLYVLRAVPVDTKSLYVVAPTKFWALSSKKSTKDETTIVTKQATPERTIKFDIKLDTNEGSGSGVEFGTGEFKIADSTAAVAAVYTKLLEQAKEQGVEDLSSIKITSFKIISSASNQWGGKVAATYSNDDKPTGIKHNAPVEDNPDWNVNNASKNYKLAQQRGVELGTILESGLKGKGISEISGTSTEARVTDTGGLNDTPGNGKEGRNKSTYPNPGQYAQLLIEAVAEGSEDLKGEPEETATLIYFTQFALYMTNLAGAGKGLRRFSNFGLSRPKYLKKSGKWKSKGYIKRHGGSKRPTSGLSHWFHNMFYSGV